MSLSEYKDSRTLVNGTTRNRLQSVQCQPRQVAVSWHISPNGGSAGRCFRVIVAPAAHVLDRARAMTAVDDGDDDGAPGRQEGVTPDTIGAVLENIRRDLGDRSTEKRRTAIALIDKQIRAWIANPALRARVVFALDAFIADLASGKLDLQKSGLVGVSGSACHRFGDPGCRP